MKQSRFYISLYIIFPFIFTGFTIFAAIVSYRLTKYGLMRGSDPVQPVFWFIVVISLLAYAAGFLLVRLILKPMEKFIEDTSKFSTFSGAKKAKKKTGPSTKSSSSPMYLIRLPRCSVASTPVIFFRALSGKVWRCGDC